MAKGMAIPIAPNSQGRTMARDGSDQLMKIIDLNLSDLENENPFQQFKGATKGEPGIDPEIIFSINRAALQARIKRSIKDFFARLEADGRAKLESGYPQMAFDSNTMDLTVKIVYVDLENSKPQEFAKQYKLESSA
jgi:hypothetical protein